MTANVVNARADTVLAALHMVIDPELGENVVDLGLIYEVTVEEDGGVRIAMTTTTRGCPATAYLKDAVQSAAWNVPGIHYVDVHITYEPPWSPEMMNDTARSRIGIAQAGRS